MLARSRALLRRDQAWIISLFEGLRQLYSFAIFKNRKGSITKDLTNFNAMDLPPPEPKYRTSQGH